MGRREPRGAVKGKTCGVILDAERDYPILFKDAVIALNSRRMYLKTFSPLFNGLPESLRRSFLVLNIPYFKIILENIFLNARLTFGVGNSFFYTLVTLNKSKVIQAKVYFLIPAAIEPFIIST
jgi:hypothetical protein